MALFNNRLRNGPHQHSLPLQWRDRLKIAMETTNAVAYLHLRLARPITIILLDGQNVAKLFHFSLVASILED
ncbi:hypothetical protein CUMW_236990 [Citrus unshiu]|nr:hypothetical protein CUMW_236990 [Citrus unshiu]